MIVPPFIQISLFGGVVTLRYNIFWKRLSDRDRGLLVSRISALFEEVQGAAGPAST